MLGLHHLLPRPLQLRLGSLHPRPQRLSLSSQRICLSSERFPLPLQLSVVSLKGVESHPPCDSLIFQRPSIRLELVVLYQLCIHSATLSRLDVSVHARVDVDGGSGVVVERLLIGGAPRLLRQWPSHTRWRRWLAW